MMYALITIMMALVLSPLLYVKRSTYHRIKQYGIDCHNSVSQRYGNKPYTAHLRAVHRYAKRYSYLLTITHEMLEIVLACAWIHDVIEDARQTYNDVKAWCGVEAAEIAYALTNEKGRTRRERADDRYYEGIKKVRYADYIKICDRLANIEKSFLSKSTMLDKYRKEHKEFKRHLYTSAHEPMFVEMERMINI